MPAAVTQCTQPIEHRVVKVVMCAPRDPVSKVLVERANGYLETSFLPAGRSPHRSTSTRS